MTYSQDSASVGMEKKPKRLITHYSYSEKRKRYFFYSYYRFTYKKDDEFMVLSPLPGGYSNKYGCAELSNGGLMHDNHGVKELHLPISKFLFEKEIKRFSELLYGDYQLFYTMILELMGERL